MNILQRQILSSLKVSVVNRTKLLKSCNTSHFAFSTVVDPSSIRVNLFHSGIAVNPHPAKVDKGGEDANYESDNVIALADGVGGWAQSGVDPALYSRLLCKNIG